MRPHHPKNRNGDADNHSQKLHKLLAQSGLGSRRGMEQLIEEGKVSVNGQPATVATRVTPEDTVHVDGRRVNLRFGVSQPRVLLYHKPEGEIVSRDDPEGRESVFDKLPSIHNARWIACGRLDINTSGLLIFTNHGELANSLTHPRFQLEREYAVRLLGRLSDDHLDQLQAGIELDDGPAHLHSIEDRGGDGANHWYHVVIKEGRNREVRRLFEAIGLTVSRLIRVRFGNLEMPPYLKRGQIKELSADQVREVMQWAGVSGGKSARQGNGEGQRRGAGAVRPGAMPALPAQRRDGGRRRRRGAGQAQAGRGQGQRGYQSRAIGPMDMGEEDPRQRQDRRARRQRRQGGRGPGQNQNQNQREQGRGNEARRDGGRSGHAGFGGGAGAAGSIGVGFAQGAGKPDLAEAPGNALPGGPTKPGRVENAEGNVRRRRRKRRGQGQARGEQHNAPTQRFNTAAPGDFDAAPAQGASSYADDDHQPGDVNGNVAAGPSPGLRSAARRPNRRRRKPVTT